MTETAPETNPTEAAGVGAVVEENDGITSTSTRPTEDAAEAEAEADPEETEDTSGA